jgi:hypothetical protein
MDAYPVKNMQNIKFHKNTKIGHSDLIWIKKMVSLLIEHLHTQFQQNMTSSFGEKFENALSTFIATICAK